MGRKRNGEDEARDYVQAAVTVEPGIVCIHCRKAGHRHTITHTYPNGNRRRICQHCDMPFVTRREKDC